jgi:translation initiation factor IF-2
MRLHELTKELDANGKRLLELAKELHLGVKSHSSNLAQGTEGILRAAWAEELLEVAEREAKKKAKAAKAAGEVEVETEAPAKKAEDAPAGEATIGITIKGKALEPEVVEPDEPAAEVAEPAAEVVDEVAAPEAAAEAEEAPAAETEQAPAAEAEEQVAEPVAAEPAEAEPVADETRAEADATEASKATADAAAGEGEPASAEPAAEPVAGDDAPATGDAPPAEGDDHESRPMVVTFGGQPAHGEEEEPPPEADAPAADAAAKATDGAGDKPAKKGVEVKGRVNVPTRKERKGAKILGRIELSKADTERSRRSAEPSFDPLDPTRAMPERVKGPGEGKPREADTHKKGGKGGKPGQQGDFVFDPEDNTSLSAIRLGHFGNRRRPPPRRPPMRRSRSGPRKMRKPLVRPTHPVTIRPPISVRDLSEELGIKTREILNHFPSDFDPRDKNAVLEAEHLETLALALDRDITVLDPDTAEGRLYDRMQKVAADLATEMGPRPPVVAVMGHVDHGKTTLLDHLRKSRVAAKEAGGITQVTSAYSVETPGGASVTFLDTPGHKAFTEMRARGASVTDVALLVVAADDGVMEQTQEAIDHARAAGVPMVVAINKIDKNNADPMKVRQQLAQAEVLVEDYGGEVGVIECSATKGDGIDGLLERLALETEILELAADPAVPARGVVIDSRKDSKLGIVATVVVQEGTLRAKDPILAGTCVGRVRWLLDDKGKRVTEAGPSKPVQVVGFEEPPSAGAELWVVDDINLGRDVAAERAEAATERAEAAVDAVTLENLFETIEAQKVTEINVLLKADNMGSLDVLRQTVQEVQHPEVRFRVIRAGVGGVTEDDVLLASASGAFVIAFGVVPDARARASVQQHGVDVKFYDVIYEMVDDLEAALEGELGTESIEAVIGHATIRAIFKASRVGNIAGCYVTDGIITRESHVRLVRDGKVIYTGRLASLKRFKDDVKEVRENYECGLHIHGYNDIKEEDVLEAFTVTEVKRTLESTMPSSE